MPSRKTSLLVVDDDVRMLRMMQRTLEIEGYHVLTAGNGEAALDMFLSEETPALILLDIMMPDMDGYSVCRRIREFSQTPIIMITAKGNEDEKVEGLDAGADDYVTKPFSTSELVARVRAVLRRTEAVETAPTQSSFASGDLQINLAQRQVTVAGKEVKLTPTEYNLLQELIFNAGKVLNHTHLLNKVWGPEYRDERQYLHVFIRRLRAKLEPDLTNPKHIITVPGVGYQFRTAA